MHDYKKLDIWKSGMDLAEKVYHATSGFSKEERYGITNQLRRAAVSIPSNIAEGAGRRTNPDFARFVDNALGSACELDTQLLLAIRFNYTNQSAVDPLLSEIDILQKKMYKFIEHLTR
jgi:four helix bundle protein